MSFYQIIFLYIISINIYAYPFRNYCFQTLKLIEYEIIVTLSKKKRKDVEFTLNFDLFVTRLI